MRNWENADVDAVEIQIDFFMIILNQERRPEILMIFLLGIIMLGNGNRIPHGVTSIAETN